MARGSRRRTPISPATVVGLALLAALITIWLGAVAQFGAALSGPVAAAEPAVPGVPAQLGVVRVLPGESLDQVAGRVAPEAPAGQVVNRIRELNKLESTAVAAGETLIAPIG